MTAAGRLAIASANPVLRTLAGSWQITEEAFINFCHHLDRQNFSVSAVMHNMAEAGYQRIGDLAVVSLVGVMTKYGSEYDKQQISTLSVARQIQAAAADPTVKAILLLIDSPGGQVRGTGDLARAINGAKQSKEIIAYIEDCGCSAAYHVASQCSSIWCNEGADVGSLGTYGVLYDISGLYESFEIKVHMISTGPYKGAGYPGTKITAEQLAKFQEHIDGKNSLFKSAVQQGRRLTSAQVDALFTGEVWIGSHAKQQGLVDGIASLDEVLAQLHSTKGKRTMTTLSASATTPETPSAATFDELEAAFPNAPATFKVDQLKKKSTLDQARANYFTLLEAQNAELNQKLTAAATAPATPAPAAAAAVAETPATPTVSQGAGKPAGAKAPAAGSDFAAIVEQECEGLTDPIARRQKRISAARGNPEAAAALNKQWNKKGVHSRIDEIYEPLTH